MPYEGEFAKHRSIRRLVENEHVKNLLKRSRVQNINAGESRLHRANLSDIPPSKWQPDWVLAIDGSHQEESIKDGYPGAEVGYIAIAAVLMNVAKIKELDFQRPVNPKSFRETENVESIDSVFPGCNIVIDSETSAKNSLRKALFETFDANRLFSDGESLLDTFEALLQFKPVDPKPDCPYADEESCLANDKKYLSREGKYSCQCSYENKLYSTDALRIHEGMFPDSANGAMFAEIMQVLECIVVVHILRWLEQNKLLWILRNMAIVLDGPLAVFGRPAWLHLAILHELNRINTVAKSSTDGQDLLLVGVEKSGTFVTHFERIDQDETGIQGKFPLQTVGLLTDEYIKKNIIFSESTKPYGSATYFGRKFFYKTVSGARLVASVPFLDESHRDMTRADPDQFPRLADAIGLLDQLVSSRYQNSLSPLISAHGEASIPMNLGARVLEKMAKELIQGTQQ